MEEKKHSKKTRPTKVDLHLATGHLHTTCPALTGREEDRFAQVLAADAGQSDGEGDGSAGADLQLRCPLDLGLALQLGQKGLDLRGGQCRHRGGGEVLVGGGDGGGGPGGEGGQSLDSF